MLRRQFMKGLATYLPAVKLLGLGVTAPLPVTVEPKVKPTELAVKPEPPKCMLVPRDMPLQVGGKLHIGVPLSKLKVGTISFSYRQDIQPYYAGCDLYYRAGYTSYDLEYCLQNKESCICYESFSVTAYREEDLEQMRRKIRILLEDFPLSPEETRVVQGLLDMLSELKLG